MEQPTRRRGGPTPYARLGLEIKVTQGQAVWERVAAGATIREAAADLGMSTTTAWRRLWFVRDWSLPTHWGRPPGPIPPQRATAACPRGAPHLPTLDGPPKKKTPPAPVPARTRGDR